MFKSIDCYSCDFETLNMDNIDYTYIWAWAGCNVENPDNVVCGSTMEEFIDYIRNKKNIFFHNAKFDFSFIIDWLFRNGFTYGKETKQFTILMSGDGRIYSMRIVWVKRDRTHQEVTNLYDSLKKLPFSVEQLAKSFEMPIKKLIGTVDYKAYRPYGHIMTEKEKQYIINDVQIVAYALRDMFKVGNVRMTIGSDALNNYIDRIGKAGMKHYFPEISKEFDDFIRKAYKGGYVYANPKYANKMVGEGIVLDVNSLYPSRMRYKPMPYGRPQYFRGEYVNSKTFPLYIQRCRVCGTLKKGYLPCLQIKGNSRFIETEYLTDTEDEYVEITVTNVDLQLIKEHYDFDIEYIDGYKFHAKTGLFDDYIDFFMEIKATSTGAMKVWAKLMLNNLYGKFGTNPVVTGKYAVYNTEKQIVQYKRLEDEIKTPPYLPIAIWTTAYGRDLTIRTAQKNIKRFLYSDTDSVHLLGTDLPEDLEIHPTKLGAWAHEATFTRGKYVRPKTYIEEIDGKLDVKAAGLPKQCKEQVTFENFKPGAIYTGKLLPKVVRGGTILKETTFKIKL